MKQAFPILRLIERVAAFAQGKGYGSATIKQEVAAVVKQLKGVPSIAIDIGGNVGDYSRMLRERFPELQIHIFEPAKSNLVKLNNIFANDKRIRIMPCGVAEFTGGGLLYADEAGSGLGSLSNRKLDHFGIKFDHAEEVALIRFSEYWENELGSNEISIVKLDIEGHELSALKGFGKALEKTHVIQFEFGGCNLDTRTTFQDFFYFFTDNGFELGRITPLGIEQVSKYREMDEFYSTTNFIARNTRF